MLKKQNRKILPIEEEKKIDVLFFNYNEERLSELGYFIPKKVDVINVFPTMSYLPNDLGEKIKMKNWTIREHISGLLVYESMFDPFKNRKERQIDGEMEIDTNSSRYFVVPLIRSDINKDESTKMVPISSIFSSNQSEIKSQ